MDQAELDATQETVSLIGKNGTSYNANVQYNSELELFCGEILGIKGNASFYSADMQGAMREFERSLSFYLDVCAKHSLVP